MQCFPTLPTHPRPPCSPFPLPSPSSLLCTVDDSDPGQSSETWGERLVPPCRIYAGNHCSPILSPVSSTSHVTHFATLCCCKHTYTHARVCVFALHPPRCSSRMSVFSNHRPKETGGGGGFEECCLHLAGLRECCLFFVCFFKPHACHLFLHVQIQEKEENDVALTMKLLLAMKLDSFWIVL